MYKNVEEMYRYTEKLIRLLNDNNVFDLSTRFDYVEPLVINTTVDFQYRYLLERRYDIIDRCLLILANNLLKKLEIESNFKQKTYTGNISIRFYEKIDRNIEACSFDHRVVCDLLFLWNRE